METQQVLTLEDFDPKLKARKDFVMLGKQIVDTYEAQLDHTKEFIDERSSLGHIDTKAFESEVARAEIRKAQKRLLLRALRMAVKDLEKVNDAVYYTQHFLANHQWCWQAEKASEELDAHSSIADDLRDILERN